MSASIEKVRFFIERNQLQRALKIIDGMLLDQDFSSFSDDLTLLKSKLTQLERDHRNDSITYSEYNINKARINLSTLELAKLINKNSLE